MTPEDALREEIEYLKAGILSSDSAKRAIRQAILEEREACALVAHGEIGFTSDAQWAQGWNDAAKRIYELIRSRP